MKKRNLRKLALLGLTSGLMLNGAAVAKEKSSLTPEQLESLLAIHHCRAPDGCRGVTANPNSPKPDVPDRNDGNLGYHVMTEEELMLELNAQGRALYQKLDADGKRLARLVASQRCNETNECSGLNGCQTDKNDCAGQGSCKGTSKCSVADKNLAVKLVSDKLAKKRQGAMQKK